MSLVAYGNSDSEDENDDQIESVSSSTVETSPSISNKTSATEELVSSSSSISAKKSGEKIKISIPSLKNFDDEEVKPEPKKKLTYKGGVGLFSILPPPKHSGPTSTTGFKPHILTKAKQTKPPPKKVIKAPPTSTNPDSTDDFDFDTSLSSDTDPLSNTEKDENVSDSTSGLGSFFFTLPEPAPAVAYVLPEEDVEPVKPQNYYEASSEEIPMEQNIPSTSSYSEPVVSDMQEPSSSGVAPQESDLMEDEGFRKLLGKRGREEINFIDVKGEDQITGKEQWMMRSLTEERAERPSKKRHGMPTQQQKRKHQITYLAHQAKEREFDLKNQWASNSLTRRETQAKYGF